MSIRDDYTDFKRDYTDNKVLEKRTSGILLHISSLPAPYGIGDLGPQAYKFADFLQSAKQSFWQILPLNPTDAINGYSPYSSICAYAGNYLFISPELLVRDGFISQQDIGEIPDFPKDKVDFDLVIKFKQIILDKAFSNFKKNPGNVEFKKFCSKNSGWLDDYALFAALKIYYKQDTWGNWPVELRDRDKNCLEQVKKELKEKIEKERFIQYLFFKQWKALKNYCNQKNIRFIGDIPIYVNYDSADCWQNPQNFKLDKDKKLSFVAGVPPDYFSKTGQRWGNPVYDWGKLKKDKFSWWIERIRHNLEFFDYLRLDHFRGFVAYWQIPAEEATAVNGKWVEAPAKEFFKTVLKNFPQLCLIAEDLGIITKDVKEIMKQFGFPGMKILMFAFGVDEPEHPYLPHNYIENCLVYTGTHDNNTARGWFENEADEASKQRLARYVGYESSANQINLTLLRLAMSSVAKTAIIPMQDILNLPSGCRMNIPSTITGNWQWRLLDNQITPEITAKIAQMTQIYYRD